MTGERYATPANIELRHGKEQVNRSIPKRATRRAAAWLRLLPKEPSAQTGNGNPETPHQSFNTRN